MHIKSFRAQTPHRTTQAQLILDLLRPGMLRRLRSEVGHSVSVRREIQLPVSLTAEQSECYRKVLGRFYDVLVDPNMHRLSSSRACQTKAICEELRKVTPTHPPSLPPTQPLSGGGPLNNHTFSTSQAKAICEELHNVNIIPPPPPLTPTYTHMGWRTF